MIRRVEAQAISFAQRVDEWVAAELHAGALNFDDLVLRLPGVYPTIALEALERLADVGRITAATAQNLARQARARPMEASETRSLLPLPHPLDYEWRFTPHSSRLLLDFAKELSKRSSRVLLFATPGVALEALADPIDRSVTFIGESNAVTRRLDELNDATGKPISIRRCEAGVPAHSADIVIVDPPWYPDFLRPMLAAAATACRTEGYVLFSAPLKGTRTNAVEDRKTICRFATRLGLEIAAEHGPVLTYETPFFERNALAAAGIRPLQAWRRGELIMFRKVREHSRPASTTNVRKERWCQVEIGRMRLFVRHDPFANGNHPLVSLVDGDVLPTVSRRDPRRRRAHVWTTGNRLFASDSPELVIAAAMSLADALKGSGVQLPLCGTISERNKIEHVSSVLRSLAVREAEEERPPQLLNGIPRSNEWTSQSTNFWSGSETVVSG
jgi:hypothetical protein